MSAKRVRGCPNEKCELHIRKKRQKEELERCPLCGAELIEVCRECFQPIEEGAYTTGLCLACLEKKAARREKRRELLVHGAEKAEKMMVDVAVPAALAAAEVLLSKSGKGVVKAGKKVVSSVVRRIAK